MQGTLYKLKNEVDLEVKTKILQNIAAKSIKIN